MLFANATLGSGIFVEANRERETPPLLNPLNQIFECQPFLLGEHFSVVNVAVGSIVADIPVMLKLGLSVYPAVLNYIKQVSDRPTFQKKLADVVDNKELGIREKK